MGVCVVYCNMNKKNKKKTNSNINYDKLTPYERKRLEEGRSP